MPKSSALLNVITLTNYVQKTLIMRKPQTFKTMLFIVITVIAIPSQSQSLRTEDPDLITLAEKAPFGWVAKKDLPEYLHKQIPPGCNGLYIEPKPKNDTSTLSQDLQTLDLVVEADKAQIIDGETATLEGRVIVSQGDRSISAEKMSYERSIDRASLEENVTIRQPGMLIHGEFAEVSTTQNKSTFDDASFILQENKVRGGARSVRQVSDTKIELLDGHITSCEPGNESWILEGEKLTIDRETSQGTGKNVKLKVGGIPIFYLPYISFPVGDQRRTGFLFPSIGSSDDGGLDVSVPYYWNLAPNYDATLTPRFISGRGSMLEFETRYLNRWMRTSAGIAFLPDDEGSQDKDLDNLIEEGEITEEQARPNRGSNRWLTQFEQNGGTTHGWYTRTSYTRVSDEDYFRDLGTSSLSVSSKSFLDQLVEVGYQFDNWKVSSLAQSQQVLLIDLDSPYRKLPQIDVNGRYRINNWTISLNNRYTQFRHRSDDPKFIEGNRINTDYRFSWETRYPWGYFSPEIGHKSLFYHLLDRNLANGTLRQISLDAPQATIDMGLIFEHSPGKFRQTLEPRVYYLYRKFKNHKELFDIGGDSDLNINFDTSERTFSYGQLYRDSRFIGGDRLDDANQVTIGLTSRWENNGNGREMFNVSAGQIFHFTDRKVTLAGNLSDDETEDSSEFASELKVYLGRRTELYANAIFDTESRRVNRGSAGINYASTNYQKLINFSYSFLRDLDAPPVLDNVASKDIDQLDFSFVYPLAKQWSIMGRANYDFQNEQELETFLGFEYNDCCYRLRFLARRWLDSNIANLVVDEDSQYDQGIFFEVHFKGLGGSGAKANSILNDGIFGYKNRERLIQ